MSIKHDAGVFSGRVTSSAQPCIANRRVRLYSDSENRFIASTMTNEKGRWRIRHRGTRSFWANTRRKARHRVGAVGLCSSGQHHRSPPPLDPGDFFSTSARGHPCVAGEGDAVVAGNRLGVIPWGAEVKLVC